MVQLNIYDTSNFVNVPIGGQLSSIRAFLLFLAEEHPDIARCTRLVGVTNDSERIGVLGKVRIGGFDYEFLPVALLDSDLHSPGGSLRLRYLKGLVRYRKEFSAGDKENRLNYIHTPEAFLAARMFNRGTNFVFSHGNFFGMAPYLRFYRGTSLARLFGRYLRWVVRRADGIFVLDRETQRQYAELNCQTYHVYNSVTHREEILRKTSSEGIRLLYVGRLSEVKNLPPIIIAAESSPHVTSLNIVGDGEEKSNIQSHAGPKTRLLGARSAVEVVEFMKDHDVLILNSRHEGVPMVILEAFAVGLPVITTDVGGIGEIVGFNFNAVRTDGSAESIISALEYVALNLSSLSKSAFEASEKFDYRIVNSEILNRIFTGTQSTVKK